LGGTQLTTSKARITGAVYLLYFLMVMFAASLVDRVPVVYSNAANLAANAAYVVVTLLLYQMFKPVSRNLAMLAVTISLAGCIVQSLALFHLLPPHSSLPIFGLFNLTIGYLILRSTFLPRGLGVLMALSGLGWLTVLSQELVKHVATYIEVLGIAAEGSLMLWLIVMGINVQRWNEQAEKCQR
jgi:Domain of unknown function (DUF4386)